MITNTINSWGDLATLATRFAMQHWIFRGVVNVEHDLRPAIGRPDARQSVHSRDDVGYSEDAERRMVDRFVREVRPHLEITPTSKFDWLAVAQHHGLKTRLLDWSDSPLIAAYFAVEKGGIVDGESTDAAVYGTPIPYVMEQTGDQHKTPGNEAVFAFYPPHITSRITTQRGLFTYHRHPDESWTPMQLEKWIIPSRTCLDLKLCLNRAGINRASLFPDADGLAAHINWTHKWNIQ